MTSCTDDIAGNINPRTPLRRFALSFAPTPMHGVKINQMQSSGRGGWCGEQIVIREPGKSRGKHLVTAIGRIGEPFCWQINDGDVPQQAKTPYGMYFDPMPQK